MRLIIDQLLAIFETRRKAGETFEVAIRTPLSVILASPGFLYLNESGNESERRQLSDRELAVRLDHLQELRNPVAHRRTLVEFADIEKIRSEIAELFAIIEHVFSGVDA